MEFPLQGPQAERSPQIARRDASAWSAHRLSIFAQVVRAQFGCRKSLCRNGLPCAPARTTVRYPLPQVVRAWRRSSSFSWRVCGDWRPATTADFTQMPLIHRFLRVSSGSAKSGPRSEVDQTSIRPRSDLDQESIRPRSDRDQRTVGIPALAPVHVWPNRMGKKIWTTKNTKATKAFSLCTPCPLWFPRLFSATIFPSSPFFASFAPPRETSRGALRNKYCVLNIQCDNTSSYLYICVSDPRKRTKYFARHGRVLCARLFRPTPLVVNPCAATPCARAAADQMAVETLGKISKNIFAGKINRKSSCRD